VSVRKPRGSAAAALRSAVVGALAARLSYSLLRARPPGGAAKWSRTNHRGEPVTLLEGPAVAIGGVAGALAAGGSSRDRLAMAIAGAGAAAFGGYDDLAGNGSSRGFRGHLGALRNGEITTGAVKLAGIGAVGLAAAVIAGGSADGAASAGGADRVMGRRAVTAALADAVINAGLIAGSANLINLFDLRPGRAAKVALIAGSLLAPASTGASAAPLAAAAALLPEDLGERAMLGDAGANALGAMLGTAAATSLSRPARLAALGVITGLTAASEAVSFTEVIERTGPLRWLDMLGRRPAPATRAPAPEQQAHAPSAPGGATLGSTAAGNGALADSIACTGKSGARDSDAGPGVGKHRAGTLPSAEGR
jgi:UDP-GlcNAc:undecaprenyl-phosphate/decaprenyl-phosphate GlcNAc-1-phosphate transferase